MNNFYTYAYLREDGTPYYIGKGRGKRAFNSNRRVTVPKYKSRIIFIKKNLDEYEAKDFEIRLIRWYGRKDLGTGILRNRTNGGEGVSGLIVSEETRRKMSEANKNRIYSEETRRKMSEALKGKPRSEETRRKIANSLKGKQK